MYSDTGNTTSLVLGFPIRTSSDQRSVDSSPRHNAASHVLHRPLMPRHPPCALKHLQTQKPIVLKNRNYTTTNHTPRHETRRPATRMRSLMLATTIHESNTTPHHQAGQQHTDHPHRAATPTRLHKGEHPGGTGLLSQSPTVCLVTPAPRRRPPKETATHDAGF